MVEAKAKMDESGRIVIPAAYRKALGLEPGVEVRLVLEEGNTRIITLLVGGDGNRSPSKAIQRMGEGQARLKRIAAAIEHAQAVVAKHVPEGRSLSEELTQERRREAANE